MPVTFAAWTGATPKALNGFFMSHTTFFCTWKLRLCKALFGLFMSIASTPVGYSGHESSQWHLFTLWVCAPAWSDARSRCGFEPSCGTSHLFVMSVYLDYDAYIIIGQKIVCIALLSNLQYLRITRSSLILFVPLFSQPDKRANTITEQESQSIFKVSLLGLRELRDMISNPQHNQHLQNPCIIQ